MVYEKVSWKSNCIFAMFTSLASLLNYIAVYSCCAVSSSVAEKKTNNQKQKRCSLNGL